MLHCPIDMYDGLPNPCFLIKRIFESVVCRDLLYLLLHVLYYKATYGQLSDRWIIRENLNFLPSKTDEYGQHCTALHYELPLRADRANEKTISSGLNLFIQVESICDAGRQFWPRDSASSLEAPFFNPDISV